MCDYLCTKQILIIIGGACAQAYFESLTETHRGLTEASQKL